MGLDLETNYKPGWPKQMGKIPTDDEMDEAAAEAAKKTVDRMVRSGNSATQTEPRNTVQTAAGPQPPDARFIDHCKAEIEKADVIIQDCDKKIAEQNERRLQAVRAKKMARAAVDAGTDGKDVDG